MNKIPEKYWTYFIYLALTITTLAVFWQVRSFEFTNYDDDKYVSQNNHISSGFSGDNLKWLFTRDIGRWHPLTGITHMLDCKLFGLNPGGHHLTNLLLHIANTLLFFVIFKRATGALWKSAFVAALFAIHPLHVESVAWISGRKDLLSTLFWILTIGAYFRYVESRSLGWYAIAIVLFALGLLAKPMVVTLPFVLLLLDYWPLERFEFKIPLRLIWEKVPFLIIAGFASIITFFLFRSVGQVQNIKALPLISRVNNAVIAYVKYIEKMIWPAGLAANYPYSENTMPTWQIIAAAVLLLAITVRVILLGKKYKYLPVGWFMFLGTLVPVIGLIQINALSMADRYTYLSLTGLFIIVAWGTTELLAKWEYKRIVLSLSSVVVILVLSVYAWFQTGYWRNSINLFSHVLEVTSRNRLAYYNRGCAYYDKEEYDLAISDYSKAIEIESNDVKAYYNRGNAYAKGKGEYDLAISDFNKALQCDPGLVNVYQNMGKTLSLQGKLEEAAKNFREALSREPLNPELHSELGAILGRQGRLDEAVSQFNEALRIKPDFAEAHGNLGYTLLNQDKFDQAVTHLTRAVQLDPNSDKSHYYLAIALTEKGRIDEAVTHYDYAIRLKPDWVEPMNTLAWLLATHKDAAFYNPQRAVQLARRACELTNYRNAEMLDTLAAACAAVGNFPDAVVATEKALILAQSAGDTQMTERIQKRLDLYKAGQPYVEPLKK
jgi:tetratricopeptide (TPR) repeat protein